MHSPNSRLTRWKQIRARGRLLSAVEGTIEMGKVAETCGEWGGLAQVHLGSICDLAPPKHQIAGRPAFALRLGFVASAGEFRPRLAPVVGALGGPFEVA